MWDARGQVDVHSSTRSVTFRLSAGQSSGSMFHVFMQSPVIIGFVGRLSCSNRILRGASHKIVFRIGRKKLGEEGGTASLVRALSLMSSLTGATFQRALSSAASEMLWTGTRRICRISEHCGLTLTAGVLFEGMNRQ